LRLDKTGSDVTDIETTTADFAEGTLTDVVAVNDGLELVFKKVYLDDDFENGNINGWNGDTVNVLIDDTSKVNGTYSIVSDSSDAIIWNGEDLEESYNEMYFHCVDGAGVGQEIKMLIRYQDDNNYYDIRWGGNSALEFAVTNGGTRTVLTSNTQDITAGTTYMFIVSTDSDYFNARLCDSNGNEIAGVRTYDTTFTHGYTGVFLRNEANIYVDDVFQRNQDYEPTGTRQSPQLDLSPIDTVASSQISWQETLNAQSITIETSVDGGSTWQTATNGGSIPNLPANPTILDVRQVLSTTDTTVTPRLESLEVEVVSAYETTGYRISKPFDLSPAVEDGGSTITWQETKPTNTSITVETSTDDGATWDTATNGQPIPNLPTDLQGVELKYKTTLNTSDTSITPTFDEINIDVLTDNASIEDGTEILETRANFVPTEQLISSVADKMNFWWKIDSDKVLHFKSRDSEPADWQLEPQYIRGLPTAKTGNPLYRNQQLVKGPIGITEEQVDVERGDGDKKAFPVSFPIAEEPTIEISINGGAWQTQTVGRKGVDDGFQWYWEKESDIITHDNAESRLTSNDRVRCTFIGQFKIVAQTYDSNLISKQADIDGTSGIVEDAITVGNVEGREAAIEIGNSRIEKYGVDSKRLKFQTRRSGLKAGQLITVNNLTSMGINQGEKLLITRTNTFDENGQIFYDIEAVKGPKHKTWEEFFMELTKRAELVVSEGIGESEILIIPIDFSKTWTFAENPNIFRKLKADGTWQADGTYTPNFEPNDRVTHIAWFNGDTELGRQERTQQDVNTADRVDTLTYLGPNSANENITHFGWIGGFRATEQIGTGVLIDKQPYDLIKKETEALQISRLDYSWNY